MFGGIYNAAEFICSICNAGGLAVLLQFAQKTAALQMPPNAGNAIPTAHRQLRTTIQLFFQS
jgi:hypothetical protein